MNHVAFGVFSSQTNSFLRQKMAAFSIKHSSTWSVREQLTVSAIRSNNLMVKGIKYFCGKSFSRVISQLYIYMVI